MSIKKERAGAFRKIRKKSKSFHEVSIVKECQFYPKKIIIF